MSRRRLRSPTDEGQHKCKQTCVEKMQAVEQSIVYAPQKHPLLHETQYSETLCNTANRCTSGERKECMPTLTVT